MNVSSDEISNNVTLVVEIGVGFIIAVIIWAVIMISNSLQDRRRIESNGETPLDIVNKRYAKGEISKEELEQIKKDLES